MCIIVCIASLQLNKTRKIAQSALIHETKLRIMWDKKAQLFKQTEWQAKCKEQVHEKKKINHRQKRAKVIQEGTEAGTDGDTGDLYSR